MNTSYGRFYLPSLLALYLVVVTFAGPAQAAKVDPFAFPVRIYSAELVPKSSGKTASLYMQLINETARRSPSFVLRVAQRQRQKVKKTIKFPDGIAARTRVKETVEVALPGTPGQVCYLVQLQLPSEIARRRSRRQACAYVRIAPDAAAGPSSDKKIIPQQLPRQNGDQIRSPADNTFKKLQ